MNRNYGQLLAHGNTAQLEKLNENNHKPGFNNVTLDYVDKRIEDELKELKKADLIKDKRREYADIANFAHMGILACDKIIGEQANGD